MDSKLTPATPPATVGQALQYCSAVLEHADVHFGHGTDNAWDEAVTLVLHVAGLSVDTGDGVLPHRFSQDMFEELATLLRRRVQEHVPLPYLIGRAWFAGLEFRCDERAIVPRSPIAELILHDFEPWYAGPKPRRILDLCCGGGCIGLATAWHNPQVQVDLVDIDEGALALAGENAGLLGLRDRVEILHSDLFEAVRERKYDLVLSNPPYVNGGDLAAMPREFYAEPELSLGSGEDGLELTRRILAQVGDFLAPEGLLVLEVGYSWPALEEAYPQVPFTWVEFEHGGDGVFVLTAGEWQDYSESWRR